MHLFLAYAISSHLPIIGKFLANIEHNETSCKEFIPVTTSKVASWKTYQDLNLIRTAVNAVEKEHDQKLKLIIEFHF